MKYCNTVNKFKDCVLNDLFFFFLFSLTLVQLYNSYFMGLLVEL